MCAYCIQIHNWVKFVDIYILYHFPDESVENHSPEIFKRISRILSKYPNFADFLKDQIYKNCIKKPEKEDKQIGIRYEIENKVNLVL